MGFMGVLATVAQAGQVSATSAPTGVSIATSSSGNYNNAIMADEMSGCAFGGMNMDGSGFSTGSTDIDVGVSAYGNFTGCESFSKTEYEGYIRATGATSFAWDLAISSSSLSNGCVASIEGTASTDQDEITGHIGKWLKITFGGGRGGQTYPAAGDSLEIDIDANATNSSGTTAASTVSISYSFEN
mgnify:CR=1 FL=1